MRILAIWFVLANAAIAGSFPECVLDDIPGAQNDVVARRLVAECLKRHPYGYNSAEAIESKGSKYNSFFGYKNGAECTIAKAKNTASPFGAQVIQGACVHLYDFKPISQGPYDDLIPAKK